MSEPTDCWRGRRPPIPASSRCADCDAALAEPFGWCSGCRKAYCFPCGRRHYCTPRCPSSGCIAGLCVRVVSEGTLAETWGLPDD